MNDNFNNTSANMFDDYFQKGNIILYKPYEDDNSTIFRFRNKHAIARGLGGISTLGFGSSFGFSNIFAIIIKIQDRNFEEACTFMEEYNIPVQQMSQDNEMSVKGEDLVKFLKQVNFYVTKEKHKFFTSHLVTIAKSPEDEVRHESLKKFYLDKIKLHSSLDYIGSLGTRIATNVMKHELAGEMSDTIDDDRIADVSITLVSNFIDQITNNTGHHDDQIVEVGTTIVNDVIDQI
ncbi:hypothetical protein C1645_778270, partial [Glomus cerebriforme]